MPDIFINYRTGDGEQAATTIERELSQRFGNGVAFRASESIKPGRTYPDELLAGVRSSSALLALIGPGWIDAPDTQRPGRRALDNEEDWVRKEIMEAFARVLPVIPVLIGRRMERLKSSLLPQPLARLAYIQSMRYDTQQASADLARIGDVLAELVPGLDKPQDPPADPGQGSVHNTTGDGDGPSTQGRDISGDVTNTVIHNASGSVNTGSGTQNNYQNHATGDGTTFIAGDNQGGISHNFGAPPRERGDER